MTCQGYRYTVRWQVILHACRMALAMQRIVQCYDPVMLLEVQKVRLVTYVDS